MIPLNHVQPKKVKLETVPYNLTKTINWNDYTTGARNNHKLKSLSEKICDNVIFNYIVPIDPNNTNKVEYLSKFLAEYISEM